MVTINKKEDKFLFVSQYRNKETIWLNFWRTLYILQFIAWCVHCIQGGTYRRTDRIRNAHSYRARITYSDGRRNNNEHCDEWRLLLEICSVFDTDIGWRQQTDHNFESVLRPALSAVTSPSWVVSTKSVTSKLTVRIAVHDAINESGGKTILGVVGQ